MPSDYNTDEKAHTETDQAPNDVDGAYNDCSNNDHIDDSNGAHSDGLDGLSDVNGSGVNEEEMVIINSDNE